MIGFFIRSLILWLCRLGGVCNRALKNKLVFNFLVLVTIAGGLWLAERVVAPWAETRAMSLLAAISPGVSSHPQQREDGGKQTQGQEASEPGLHLELAGTTKNPESEAAETAKESDGEPNAKKSDAVDSATTKTERNWLTFWNVVSIWAFGLLIWWVTRARKRLVLGKFEDFTGGDAGAYVKGLGALVAVDLSRLGDLFEGFDLDRAIQATPEKLKPVDATIQAESLVQFMEQAVSTEASFSMGPFRIPVGVIMGLVGRLVQGPRLIGQIHRDGDQRIVTVQMLGSQGGCSWRLSEQGRADENGVLVWRPAADLGYELACRIFAEVALGGAVSWRALSKFIEALRSYRLSLRTGKQSKLNLRDAEHRLIEAVAEDTHFDLAYYNLGVVYTELNQLDAAGVAFTRAIQVNNRRWSAYYALAQNRYERAIKPESPPTVALLHLFKATDLCDRAIRLAPSAAVTANVQNLKTLALWRCALLTFSPRFSLDAARNAVRAVRTAWKALCWAELGAGNSLRETSLLRDQARSQASTCLQNLSEIQLQAVQLMRMGGENKRRQAAEGADPVDADLAPPTTGAPKSTWMQKTLLWNIVWNLRQARALTPWIADIHLHLGLAYLERCQFTRAITDFRTAARVQPESGDPWGHLALAAARCGKHNQVREAYLRVLENLPSVSNRSLADLTEATKLVGEGFVQIRAFVAGLPGEARTKSRMGFIVWYSGRFMHYSSLLVGRRLVLIRQGAMQLSAFLSDPNSADESLSAEIEFWAKRGDRTAMLQGFRKEVDDLSDERAKGVQRLKKLLAEMEKKEYVWEAGEVAHKLALLYLEMKKLDQAERYIGKAIEFFQASHQDEVQRRGLYAQLAIILRRGNKLIAALEQAKNGVARDPVGDFEWTELGWAYFQLAEYALAQDAWENALLWAPNRAGTHRALGLCDLIQLSDCKDKPSRTARLDRATHNLRNALDLFEGDPIGRSETRFLLAHAHVAAGRFVQARTELRALEPVDYCNLAVSLQLADAYLENEEFKQAEMRFSAVATDIDQRIAEADKGANEVVEAPLGNMTLGTASAFAHLGLAASYVDREIKLDEALAEVGRARKAIDGLDSRELMEEWKGNCDLWEGAILFKQDKIDESLEKLEMALVEGSSTAVYYYLSAVLVRKIERAGKGANQLALIQRAKQYCESAERTDWTGQWKDKIAHLTEFFDNATTP